MLEIFSEKWKLRGGRLVLLETRGPRNGSSRARLYVADESGIHVRTD
jgi:hypothetical protein